MTISLCTKEKRSVSMVYHAHKTKEAIERIVDPYGLVFFEGVWVLIGYCHLRKGIRSFAIDRIIDLKERFLYFEIRGGFNLEEYISRAGVSSMKNQSIQRSSVGCGGIHPQKRKMAPLGAAQSTAQWRN